MSGCPTCKGGGEVTVGTRQDEFGNWDTETYSCPDCEGTGVSGEKLDVGVWLASDDVTRIAQALMRIDPERWRAGQTRHAPNVAAYWLAQALVKEGVKS